MGTGQLQFNRQSCGGGPALPEKTIRHAESKLAAFVTCFSYRQVQSHARAAASLLCFYS
jgi:hypothetical protein